jgi:type IV secretion system protein VirB9
MRSVPILAAVFAIAFAGATARAQVPLAPPAPAATDTRIKTLPYDPDKVVLLNAYIDYQTMIQFGADERIEDVAIGNGENWQITPNKGANLLFVKPLDRAARTNMTVVTDRRSYLFELAAEAAYGGGGGQMTYVLRFDYPPAPAVSAHSVPPPPAPEQRNRAYSYTGSRALLPSQVFDDGRFTYFKWPESEPTPAVFLLAKDGSESLADYSYRDGYQVVEQVAPRFRLRDGKQVTTVINDGWRAANPGSDAPRPHDRKTARAARTAGTPG